MTFTGARQEFQEINPIDSVQARTQSSARYGQPPSDTEDMFR
jgi:hypothetical protein